MSFRPPGTDHPAGRNVGIDLIRGISIVLVVIHHTSLRIPVMQTSLSAILPKRFLIGLSSDGYEAVFVFFVVSGFLIATNSIRRWTSLARLDPRIFYIRRAARILPCLVLLVAVLASLDPSGVSNYVITRADQSLPRAILAAFAFHLNWYEGHTGSLPGGWDVTWSLSVEEVFHLGFPLVCLLVGRYWMLQTILFAALALSLPLLLHVIAHAPKSGGRKPIFPGSPQSRWASARHCWSRKCRVETIAVLPWQPDISRRPALPGFSCGRTLSIECSEAEACCS
ncbi:acyltransferase [Lichenicola cladoniae]|uniref:Acyltransferase n=1 Tax=Lichenicola cladoniae TaxID=1484109 RepID=A0A6M8HN62_9PROT|nr:acyltransferase [Lichenicola cladoniae]NPD67248.1 acyltransferase [Acetobacteraceae bacterium]QKE89756.1 acyltransferase [Lichenicola cladoniae]